MSNFSWKYIFSKSDPKSQTIWNTTICIRSSQPLQVSTASKFFRKDSFNQDNYKVEPPWSHSSELTHTTITEGTFQTR